MKIIWQELLASVTFLILAAAAVPSPVAADPSQSSLATAGAKQCNGSKLTSVEIDEILRIHNQARAQVGVQPLTWDCVLAEYAQKWVDQDKFEHSSDADYKAALPVNYRSTGENLASLAGSKLQMSKDGPALWVSERANWNNATAKCRTGKVCEHYTQVVWRQTTKVGCGINRNSTVLGASWRGQTQFLSCNYNPAGNVSGRKPY